MIIHSFESLILVINKEELKQGVFIKNGNFKKKK